MEADFKYSLSLIKNFFSSSKVRHSLNLISENDITGWEVWMQVEFSTFISLKYCDQIEWYREFCILPDGRKCKNRTRMAADFVFRRKGHKLDRYNVLEFKQHPNPKTCFSNMYKDVVKIEKAKESSIDMRSFWVVGIHEKAPMTKAEIKKHIAENFGMEKNLIETSFIPGTPLAFTIY